MTDIKYKAINGYSGTLDILGEGDDSSNLLDIMMPGWTALDVQEDQETNNIPIIMLSAHDLDNILTKRGRRLCSVKLFNFRN